MNHPAASFEVKVPTLVIWGEKDPYLLADNLNGLEQYVPKLMVVRIPDATHWVVHEQPASVNELIRDFLAASK
jgi:pimeloyl-ACP methyl ester carboxylesterase